MKKKDLLHALRRIGLEDEIIFTRRHGEEHELDHAFVITGLNGLVLILADAPEAAGFYADAETA